MTLQGYVMLVLIQVGGHLLLKLANTCGLHRFFA